MNNNTSQNLDTDSHVPILNSDHLQQNDPQDPVPPPQRASFIVRQNILRDLQIKVYGSIAFCLGTIAFAVLKIIVSSLVLAYNDTHCNQPIDNYFIYMMIHDILTCLALTLKLSTIVAVFNWRNLQEEAETAYYNPLHQWQTSERLSRYKLRVQVIVGLIASTNIYYCLLFLYAHLLYFEPESDCAEVAPVKNDLMLAHMILGYITIILPTISFLLVCFCLPFILLGSYLFKKDPNAATKKMVDKLPVTKYTTDLPGDTDCSICMNEYKNQDNIIQLKCNPKHYFHDDCIKKWLRINGHCPICRQKIGEEGNRGNMDIELQQINAYEPPTLQQSRGVENHQEA